MPKPFVVQHRLDLLSEKDLEQYLREMSAFIGLDPDLNGLSTIWLDNETGVGRTLTPYAKRGTAEILRNIYNVDVKELTHSMVGGSIVFAAAGEGGRNGVRRWERAIGSKYIKDLVGRPLDNGIMTASTRALRRLTMQFTTLGILDESEVVDIVGQPVNLAAGATLAGSPVVIPPQPQVPANNQPGTEMLPLPISQDQAQVALIIVDREIQKLKTPPVYPEAPASATVSAFATSLPAPPQDKLPVPPSQVEAAEAAKTPPVPVADGPAAKTKKSRKQKNSVTLDVEPEVVAKDPVCCLDCKRPLNEHPLINSERVCPNKVLNAVVDPIVHQVAKELMPPPPAPPAPPAPVNAPPVPAPPVPAPPVNVAPPPVAAPAADMPTKEQMDEYRKKIGVFTQQLPATPGLGSVQRMRAFITKMFDAPPQNLNVAQWEKVIAWFDDFTGRNGAKGLIIFIGDTLGDVPKGK